MAIRSEKEMLSGVRARLANTQGKLVGEGESSRTLTRGSQAGGRSPKEAGAESTGITQLYLFRISAQFFISTLVCGTKAKRHGCA